MVTLITTVANPYARTPVAPEGPVVAPVLPERLVEETRDLYERSGELLHREPALCARTREELLSTRRAFTPRTERERETAAELESLATFCGPMGASEWVRLFDNASSFTDRQRLLRELRAVADGDPNLLWVARREEEGLAEDVDAHLIATDPNYARRAARWSELAAVVSYLGEAQQQAEILQRQVAFFRSRGRPETASHARETFDRLNNALSHLAAAGVPLVPERMEETGDVSSIIAALRSVPRDHEAEYALLSGWLADRRAATLATPP